MDEEEIKNEEEKKHIEVIQGNGSDLNISPVYDHIKMDKDKKDSNKNEKIVVPKKKK